jgi:hypothetical protein
MSAHIEAPKAYTPKEYFSPSSISLGRRCMRRWGFRYLNGIKEPEIPYEYFLEESSIAEVQGLPESLRMLWYSMRSKALGGAVHAVLEAHFLSATDDRYVPLWNSPQGIIARAMVDELPKPEACEAIETETEITIDTSFYGKGSDPIVFTGKADLLVKVEGYWYLYDYKTTKAIKNDFAKNGYNYVKTADELREDEQAGLYSLHAMQRAKVDSIACAWVYGRTKGKAEATSTKFVMGLARAQTLTKALIVDAERLRATMRSGAKAMDLEGNAEACGDFGRKCEHHISNGGPCTVKQSLGTQLLQIRKKEENTMAMKFADQLKAAKSESKATPPKGGKAAKGKAKVEETEEAEEEEAEEEEEEEEAKPAKGAKKAPAKAAKGAKKEAAEVERAEASTVTIASGGVTITVSADLSEAETVSAIADKIAEEIFG